MKKTSHGSFATNTIYTREFTTTGIGTYRKYINVLNLNVISKNAILWRENEKNN